MDFGAQLIRKKGIMTRRNGILPRCLPIRIKRSSVMTSIFLYALERTRLNLSRCSRIRKNLNKLKAN